MSKWIPWNERAEADEWYLFYEWWDDRVLSGMYYLGKIPDDAIDECMEEVKGMVLGDLRSYEPPKGSGWEDVGLPRVIPVRESELTRKQRMDIRHDKRTNTSTDWTELDILATLSDCEALRKEDFENARMVAQKRKGAITRSRGYVLKLVRGRDGHGETGYYLIPGLNEKNTPDLYLMREFVNLSCELFNDYRAETYSAEVMPYESLSGVEMAECIIAEFRVSRGNVVKITCECTTGMRPYTQTGYYLVEGINGNNFHDFLRSSFFQQMECETMPDSESRTINVDLIPYEELTHVEASQCKIIDNPEIFDAPPADCKMSDSSDHFSHLTEEDFAFISEPMAATDIFEAFRDQWDNGPSDLPVKESGGWRYPSLADERFYGLILRESGGLPWDGVEIHGVWMLGKNIWEETGVTSLKSLNSLRHKTEAEKREVNQDGKAGIIYRDASGRISFGLKNEAKNPLVFYWMATIKSRSHEENLFWREHCDEEGRLKE